tara:strand:- start:5152 stop:5853 length:702 start_codon:yes stop_codon:yes gene_type:complete
MKPIPIFIGYDPRERAATNVLIDSLYQNSKSPLSLIPLVTSQLENQNIFHRKRDPNQSTAFSFTRFLVPYLMNYEGWALFIDCDMLCKKDIGELWDKRDDKFSLMCVQHEHSPTETIKFQNEIQTAYPKKNWSSLMLFNCNKCRSLTLDYVNSASGLDLHRFNWLEGDHQIGSIPVNEGWNFLIGVQNNEKIPDPSLMHWTLGGPWFKEQRLMGGKMAAEWFSARDDAFKLWS